MSMGRDAMTMIDSDILRKRLRAEIRCNIKELRDMRSGLDDSDRVEIGGILIGLRAALAIVDSTDKATKPQAVPVVQIVQLPHKGKPTAIDRVLAHLQACPNDIGLTARELADKTGVGKSTAAKAVGLFRPN